MKRTNGLRKENGLRRLIGRERNKLTPGRINGGMIEKTFEYATYVEETNERKFRLTGQGKDNRGTRERRERDREGRGRNRGETCGE